MINGFALKELTKNIIYFDQYVKFDELLILLGIHSECVAI